MASDENSTVQRNTLGSEVRNVGKHSLIYMLAPAISKIIGFLLFPLYTSFISTSNYGVNSLIEIAMTFAMLVMSINLADGMTRFYYATDEQQRRRQVVSTVITGIALFGFPLVLLFACSANPLAAAMRLDAQFVPLLRLAFLAAWFSMLAEIGFAYLRMRYMSKTFVATTVLQILLMIGLNILFVVYYRLDIWGILYSTVIVQGLLGIGLTLGIMATLKAKPSWSIFRELFKFGAPLMPATVSQQLNNYVHPLMLQWLTVSDPVSAATQVGIFAAGQKIGVVVNRFAVVPFNGFWKPRRMELVMQSGNEVKRIIAKMCTYATVTTTAFGLLLSAAAESGLLIMNAYGFVGDEAYLKAHLVVPLIALAYVIHSLEHHFATGMHASGKTRQATMIGLISLAATVSTNWLLIPRLGFVAAAIATVVGVTVRSLAFLVVSQRRLSIPFEFRRLAVAIGIAVGLYLGIRWIAFDSVWLTLFARMAIGALFVPTLVVTGFLDASELSKLREFARRVRRVRIPNGPVSSHSSLN